MVRRPKQTLKQQLKNNLGMIVILVIVFGMVVLGIVAENHREANRQAYAKRNNCTWYATGTMYGDDRDFICK